MNNARKLGALVTLFSHVSNLVGLSNNQAAIQAKAAEPAFSVPPGTLFDFAGSSVPSGYLAASGAAVSRATYAALYAAIGTTYGVGDGTTTFNLPDLRGRTTAGLGGSTAGRLTVAGAGVNGDTLGASGGSETHVLTTAQLASHSHTGTVDAGGAHSHLVMQAPTTGSGGTAAPVFTAVAGSGNSTSTSAAPDHTHTFTTATSGTGTAHNNTQPTLVINKIIKT